jgi:hypothetical protein
MRACAVEDDSTSSLLQAFVRAASALKTRRELPAFGIRQDDNSCFHVRVLHLHLYFIIVPPVRSSDRRSQFLALIGIAKGGTIAEVTHKSV